MTNYGDMLETRLARATIDGVDGSEVAALACVGVIADDVSVVTHGASAVRAACLLAWLTLVRAPRRDTLWLVIGPWKLEMVAQKMLDMEELVDSLRDVFSDAPFEEDDVDEKIIDMGAMRLFGVVRSELESRWRRGDVEEQLVAACEFDGVIGLEERMEANGHHENAGSEGMQAAGWMAPLVRVVERWGGAGRSHRGVRGTERVSGDGATDLGGVVRTIDVSVADRRYVFSRPKPANQQWDRYGGRQALGMNSGLVTAMV